MKSIWREIVLAVLMGMILPGIVVDYGIRMRKSVPPVVMETAKETASIQTSLSVKFRQDFDVKDLAMDTYLAGVLLVEMPGDFELEAFKAQAVAGRTYALKASVTGGKHGDGSVCGDSVCCQAYISIQDYLDRGGSWETVEKIRDAVQATSGLVLTYEGELIEATYFSCSGGSTEDAVAVWGTYFPYLRATESPGEEYAVHYSDTVSFPLDDFSEKLGVALSGDDWLGIATYTAGDGVHTICIGEKEFKGTELRQILGLRSTNFEIIPDGKQVTVTTKGFGHRVGMSQYGADAMAAAGSNFQQILEHYYQGTTIERWEN